MAKTKLEITVFDEVQTADSLKRSVEIILQAFKKWAESSDDKPFRLSVRKMANKAPPTLEVKVTDEVVTKTAFG